jgi:hypothetical protein
MHEYVNPRVADEGEPVIAGLEDSDIEDCEAIIPEIKHFFRENAGDATISSEVKIEILDENMKEITFGSADLVSNGDAVVGCDVKSGLDYKPWLHDYRGQIKAYALGRMQQKGARTAVWSIAFVRTRKIIVYQLTYEECEAAVYCAYQRKKDQYKVPQTCTHCKMCGEVIHCPAVNPGLALVVQAQKKPDLPASILHPDKITDPTEMSRAMVFCDDVLSAWIKRMTEMQDHVYDCALAMSEKTDLPFYARLVKKGTKNVKDKDGAWGLLRDCTTKEVFYSSLKMSLPELAKAYAKEQKGLGSKITEKDARKYVEGILDPVIEIGPSKNVLERTREERGRL